MSSPLPHGGVVPEEEAAANSLRRRRSAANPPPPTQSSPSAATTSTGGGDDDDDDDAEAADFADADTDAALTTILLLASFVGILSMRSLRARLLSLAYACCCVLSLACALVLRRRPGRLRLRRRRPRGGGASSSFARQRRRRRRRWMRGTLAVALRLGFAAVCNAVVAGGRQFPTVSRWTRKEKKGGETKNTLFFSLHTTLLLLFPHTQLFLLLFSPKTNKQKT